MTAKPLILLRQRRDELERIDATWSNWNEVTEWHARTLPMIAQYFAAQLPPFEQFIQVKWAKYVRMISLASGGRSAVSPEERAANDKIANNAKQKFLAHLDAIAELTDIEESDTVRAVPATGQKVFVVHGRNERWLQEVARFIEKLGSKVIVLREQPNEGRTIIEKFEDIARQAGFAVILLTGDDRGGLADAPVKTFKARVRQNVMLELGFFLGLLGRSRVCALYEDGVEIPTDYSGVLFVPLNDSGSWRIFLAKEMKAAGIPVDMNKAI